MALVSTAEVEPLLSRQDDSVISQYKRKKLDRSYIRWASQQQIRYQVARDAFCLLSFSKTQEKEKWRSRLREVGNGAEKKLRNQREKTAAIF